MDAVEKLEPKDIVALCEKEGLSSISYTYNDPVVYYEYVLDTARLAHAKGIKNILVTASYINQEPLKNLCPYIDAATVDIKSMTESFYRRFNTAKLQPVLDALVTMKKAGVWLEVSFLVIPDENDKDDELRKFSDWVRDNLGAETPVHFLRFFPLYKLTMKPPTPANTLKRAARIAKDEGLKFVYIGNLPESGVEDTFCPHCGKKIITRDGYMIREIKVQKGQCEYCGYAINGKW
jgi:pyruvate formate lyase activating enzyme